ncbi:MAG: hypothetical protein ACLVFT_03925, partial [Megasphaera lornae]
AFRYVPNPSVDLQLLAVQKNYDAIKFIKDPAPEVQEAAVKSNYEALRYIENPTREARCSGVKENERALPLLREVTKEDVIEYLKLNILSVKYLPPSIVLSDEEWEAILTDVLSDENVEEKYVRNFINCRAFDRDGDVYPMNKLQFIYDRGSKKAKRITVDEKLSFK